MGPGDDDGLPSQCVTRRRNARGDGYSLRGEILDASHHALEEAGSPRALLLGDIADRLGVTKPSLYLHFRDKQDLLRTLADDALSDLCDEFESAARNLDLKSSAAAYIQYAVDYPIHYDLALLGTNRDPSQHRERMTTVLRRLEPFVADHLAQRFGGPSCDVRVLTMELFAATHGVASLLAGRDKRHEDLNAIVDRNICPILRGRDVPALQP